MTDNWQRGGFGLYVHWPFCQAKCPYCDFNSYTAKTIDQSQWLKAYTAEIERYAQQVPGRVLNSIFFGGGTPSLMDPSVVAAVIDTARAAWPMSNDPEITLEANPSSVEAARFADYRQAGVNRISMGVQALNDRDLQRLGRLHSVDEARRAFDIARACFDRVSFDLIYARQDQTPDMWKAELTEALSMAVDHLSLYQLTIEQGTAFGDRYNAGRLAGLPEDDSAADMYQITQDICAAHGLPAYEVSNHARPGAESRHNLVYWRYGDYVGIGPGAHGRLTIGADRVATETPLSPADWLNAVQNGSGESHRQTLNATEQGEEYLMMGLRLAEPLDLDHYTVLSGQSLSDARIDHLVDLGMLTRQDRFIAPTAEGRAVLNAILRDLLAE